MLTAGLAVLYLVGRQMMKKNLDSEKKRFNWYFIIGGFACVCIELHTQKDTLRSVIQNSGDFFFNRS